MDRVGSEGRGGRLALLAALALFVAMGVLVLAHGTGVARGTSASSAYEYQYDRKVTICHHADHHKTQTITVSENAVPAHLAHGDTVGPCPDGS